MKLKFLSLPTKTKISLIEGIETFKQIIDISFLNVSKLQKIYQFAFYESSVEYISFPASVTHIFHGAFYNCRNLKKVVFPEKSQLKIIGRVQFCNVSILLNEKSLLTKFS